MAARPLALKTIVVTRPRKQADELAGRLKRAGAAVIQAPLIRTVAPKSYRGLDAALKNLAAYDTIVFTSANAVEFFFARARALGLGRPRRPARLFAVGPRTAQALRRAAWRGAQSPKEHRGEELAKALGAVRGRRILIPRAEAAAAILPDELKKKGGEVRLVDAYRTVSDPLGLRKLKSLPLERIDAVTFTSASTAEQFFKALGRPRCRRIFTRAAAACIGPVTAAALRRLGAASVVQAKRATAAGLYQALLRHFR